jgi:protein involved in polysaccharide export with SLBB domain
MRTLTTKQPAQDSSKQKPRRDRAQSPLAVNGGRSLYSPLSTGMPLLQRKCACGGGCPRCQSALLQTKLNISEPGDRYEQEADRVADQVMRMPEPSVQRQVEPEEEEGMVQREAIFNQVPSSDQKLESPEVPSIVNEVLNSPGQPLDPETLTFMESRFGQDFNHVQVHTDAKAAESARAVNALAYTVGQNIVFSSEQYSPKTRSGKYLLSHELAHVIQQKSTSVLQKQTDSENPVTPRQTGGTSTSSLITGQVVNVQIRELGGRISEFSHEYPVDLQGCVRIPSLGCVQARGLTLVQLRQAINNALVQMQILINPTVNVTSSSKTVPYTQQIQSGDTLFVRILESSGTSDPSSGAYPVDATGRLHLPYIGDITVAGMTIAALETQIEQGLISGQIYRNPTVHVSMTQLNS